tara:strand:+ start:155 stop:514 length:360 start_codon:yes stop_codon:yes gene_type:complete
MGIKRRAMFNPKFKSSRPKRWQKGLNIKNSNQIANSEMIEIVKNKVPTEKATETEEIIEEMIQEVEEMISETPTFKYNLTELKKKRKAELLEIANSLNCEVTNKNTKAQIITAIEKQSS